MIKILVVDDHRIVRDGLRRILVDTPDMVVADEASNGEEVINKVGNNDYDLILLLLFNDYCLIVQTTILKSYFL